MPLAHPRISRNAFIAGSVVLLHGAGIYALNTGLLKRVTEVVVPIELISQILPPPPVRVELPKPVPPAPAPAPAPKLVPKPQPRTPPPAPRPVAAPSPLPAPSAATAVAEPQPPAPPITAPVTAAAPSPAPAPAPAPSAPPAPPRIELPSTDADYLQNPRPVYPPMSKRMGEQGQVMLRVLIGADGLPRESQVSRSSGYDRLDATARETVMRWRFVPGKRNGVAETMWFNVPINFVLE